MPDVAPTLLPMRPRPFGGELFSSWFVRLAHANAQRLPYFSREITCDDYFWRFDPDRLLRPEAARTLVRVTGLTADTLEALTLRRYEGTVIPRLLPRARIRWIMPLHMQGYLRRRPGLVYCPACLREELFLRSHWRLSFVTLCERHGRRLLDACPQCQAPYAPQRNDLGPGADWSTRSELPFGFCPECGFDVREAEGEAADPAVLALQTRLLAAAASGVLPWPGEGDVPSLEGFDVLHQLLGVVFGTALGDYLSATCDFDAPRQPPERRNRSFEDFGLSDRVRLLRQLAFLLEEWPERLIGACEAAGVTKNPLVVNFRGVPRWYEAVADQLSRANGRRPYKRVPLVGHLTLEELAERRDTAPTAAERRRWELLWHYAQFEDPAILPVARSLNLDKKFVHGTVTRYNAEGPASMENWWRGKSNRRKRLLTHEQEAELRLALALSPMTNAQMADWVEARTGRRPDRGTLWMYRRGVASHSNQGRRATPDSGP